MPFYFQRFLCLLQGGRGQIVGRKKRKPARCLFAVAAIDPKLRVEASVALIESGHAAIARIPHSDKFADCSPRGSRGLLSSRNSAERRRGLAQFRLSWRFLLDLALFNSSTIPSTTNENGCLAIYKSLVINDARVAKLADAPDLGSGGEILRGSSPLPGI